MVEFSLREPLQDGVNIVKVTARDYSFATTALVEVVKVSEETFCCNKITFVSTLGMIQSKQQLDKAIINYLHTQKIS